MFSKFFIYHPIFASVISIVIVIMGGVSLVTLPIARYPDIVPPTITVSATYPGANAVTVGETVATPIEQEVNGVENMAYMSSISTANGTMDLTVTFEVGTDLDMANVLVQNRVSVAESRLPEEARRQGIKVKKKSPEITMMISFYSPDESVDSSFLHNFVKQNIEDEIKRVKGVGDVLTYGTGEFGMRIWLDPVALKQRDLTTTEVLNAIREQNIEVAAGKIGAPPAPSGTAFEYVVNASGRFSDASQFEDIILASRDEGTLIYLRDVARVELGSQVYNFRAAFSNPERKVSAAPVASLAVYQLPGANAIEVADNVVAKIDELMAAQRATYGNAIDHVINYDNTRVIRASVQEVIVTLFITLVLVVFTVYIFLQNARATLVPTITIPVSLIGTFSVLAALGYSLNTQSLFGLVLVIGIVVDDAIVVVENCTRLIEEKGMAAKDAAVQTMEEVSGPVVATTLVLLAVFVPTLFMPGIVGQLFSQFAVTISIATVFSSICALTLSPALCGILLKKRQGKEAWIWRAFNGTLQASTTGVTAVVSRMIRVAVVVLLLFVGLVFVAGKSYTALPTGFVPQEDEGYCIVNVQLPDGASQERTEAVVHHMCRVAEKTPGVENALGITGISFIDGTASSNRGSVFVTLLPWDERTDPSMGLRTIVQGLMMEGMQVQEGLVMTFVPPSLPGVGMAGGFAMQLQDRGGVGLHTLQQVADEFVIDGASQQQIARMFSGFRANDPQYQIDIDREQVRQYDVPLSDVFNTLSAALGGSYANDFVKFGRIYQVRLQADAQFRTKPEDIGALEVRNRDGEMVPLSALVKVSEVFGPQVVTHYNIYPSAKINGVTPPGISSGDAMAVASDMADKKLPSTMGFEWTDLSYQEDKATGSTSIIFLFSILLVYLLLAAQYESWTLPISVCFSVPGALLGAVGAILLLGFDNNVYTQIGVVLLIGLSTKTAILIVEFAKVERESGKTARDAAVNAVNLRFRAVLMTAFSFILGTVPLLLATGAGAHSRVVLGSTVFGGMLVSTVVGVVIVPTLYFAVQRLSDKMRRIPPEGPTDEPPKD